MGVAASPLRAASEPTPCMLVVDGDPGAAASFTEELRSCFGRECRFLATLSARSGLRILERLGAAGEPVALVIAGLRLPDMDGLEFLSRARHLHPLARRVVIADLLEVVSSQALHRAMTLGQAHSWLTAPWAPSKQSFPAQVGELLDEWRDDSGRHRYALATVVGARRDARSRELRDRLARTGLPYHFMLADTAEGRELLRRAGRGTDRLPVVILYGDRVLVQPTWGDMVAACGIRLQPDPLPYDLAVAGGGLAGLSAAVQAASEGLRTVVIERESFGGQAGTSSRIRNYLGFPHGVSGRRLAGNATAQARLFGVELVFNEVTGLRPEGRERVVLLRDGSSAVAHAVVIATGVSYRRLGVPAAEALVGAGVFYGSVLGEAPALRGEEAVVVGAGNSAGQAAVHLSRFARRVTLVARGESLEESMSAYLVDELRSLENVTVRLRTQVVDVEGAGRLERVTLEATGSGARDTVPAAALFVLIGGEPRTEWLAGVLERDEGGYIRTGADLLGQAPGRMPRSLEASVPGVFAAGDVRASSAKRMATAAGDGAIAIRLVHEYLHQR